MKIPVSIGTIPPAPGGATARPAARSVGAFTLAEVMIAMGILVWFVAGLCLAGARIAAWLESQREVVAASQLIQERTEQIRSSTYAQLTDATYLQNSLLNAPANSESMLHSLVEVLTISAYPADSSAPLKATRQQYAVSLNSTNPALATAAVVRLDLQLSWLGQRGTTRTRAISTIIANGGINH